MRRCRHIDDILYVAGRAPIEGQTNYDIMFIAAAVDEDEATQHSVTTFGYRINQPAEYLKGATGIIKDVALRAGIDIDRCYYTSVCKWLLPRMKRAKPPVKILKWGLPILMDEIKRTKPKIIVCLGKQAFDLLSDRKIGFDDAHGGWFWSTEAQAHLYLMYAPYSLVGKPELYETFRIDFMEIARKKKLLDGEDIANAYELAFLRLERDEGPVNFDDAAEREKCRIDGLRVVAAYLDSPEAMKEKPRAVEVMLKEEIAGLSVPLTGAMDLVEGNFTPVDFKSAAAKPDEANAAFDHEIQLVSYQLLMEAATGETPPSLDLVFLVKTKKPQTIRITSPPADARRKQQVVGLLETAVEGIASNRYHPQPGMRCSWCQFKNECMAWLPGITVEDVRRAA